MNNTYLNFSPSGLIEEILVYLNAESIINLQKISVQANNKYFWINKLKLDNLGVYTQFLSAIDVAPQDYQKFIEINEYIQNFIHNFKGFNARMTIKMSDDINFKLLKINNLTIEELKNCSVSNKLIHIYFRDKYTYDHVLNHGELTEDEFKLLLIKLSLIGIDIYSLSNLF